jgi:hypothetical protein
LVDDTWHVVYTFDMPPQMTTDQIANLAVTLAEVSDGNIELAYEPNVFMVGLDVKGGPHMAILAGLHHVVATAKSIMVPVLNEHVNKIHAERKERG